MIRSIPKKVAQELEGYLIPEQIEDLMESGAFNVRGADRKIYRVFPRRHYKAILTPWGTYRNVWVETDTGSRSTAYIVANAIGLKVLIGAYAPHFPFCAHFTTDPVPPMPYDRKLRRGRR